MEFKNDGTQEKYKLTIYDCKNANGLPQSVGKVYKLTDCKLYSDTRYPSFFEARQLDTPLSGLVNILENIQSNQALGLGLFEKPFVEGAPSGKTNDNQVTRSKNNTHFHNGSGFMLLDVDDVPESITDERSMLDALKTACPALAHCGMVIKRSSSAGITGPDTKKTDLKWHIYVPVANATDIERATNTLFDRLWLCGFGRIVVSKNGATLERSIIDRAVASPERVIFESKPVLPDGYTRPDYNPRVIEGPPLDTLNSIPPLSSTQLATVERIKQAAKDEAKPEVELAIQGRIETVSKEKKIPLKKAERIVRACLDGYLDSDTPIHLDKGPTVPLHEAIEKYEGCYCADPNAPEEGKKKAYIFPWGLYSHLNGGKKYRLEHIDFFCKETSNLYWNLKEKEREQEKKRRKGEALAQWAYIEGKRLLYRFGVNVAEPRLWLRKVYPNLPDKYAEPLGALLDKLWRERRKKAVAHYVLSQIDLLLKRDESDKLDWDYAHQKSKNKRLIAVRAAHGSGKTSQFAKRFASVFGFVAAVHRVTLTRQLAKDLKTDHYEDRPFTTGRLTVCINSLIREDVMQHNQNIKVFLLDEAGQVRRALASLPREIRQAVYNELARICREAEQVILLDADLSDVDLNFYEGLCQSKAFVIDAEPQKTRFKARVHGRPFNQGSMADVTNHLKKGQACAVACSAKKYARLAYKKLCKDNPHLNIKLLANAPETIEKYEQEQFNLDAERFLADVDCVVYTAKMGTGFSIVNPKFTKCFGFFAQSPISPADCVQMIRRFRAVREFEITIMINGQNTYTTTKKRQPAEGLQLLRDTVAEEKVHDKAYFATALLELLKMRGFDIKRDVFQYWKPASKEQSLEDAERISVATPINPELTIPRNIKTDTLYYGVNAFHCRNLFNIPDEAPLPLELAQAFVDDGQRLQRYNDISSMAEDEWVLANNIFQMMLREKIKPSECKAIIDQVRAVEVDLKRVGALPDRWAARNVPTRNHAESVGTLAEFWGLESELVKSNGSRYVRLSVSPTVQNVKQVSLSGEPDTDSLIAEMLAQGMTHKEIAQELNCSTKKVQRLVKSWSGQNSAFATISRNILNDGKTLKCPPQETYKQTHEDYGSARSNPMPEMAPVELPNPDQPCPIQELEQQADLEVLPEDKSFVRDMLDGQGEPERQIIIHGYINAWRAGCLSEPRPHCKQNAGRLSANDWLHKEVTRMAHRL